jgi:hypothetical protein
MRKKIVGSFITFDGVMQATGGPEDGFEKYVGWSGFSRRITPSYSKQLNFCILNHPQSGLTMYAVTSPTREQLCVI